MGDKTDEKSMRKKNKKIEQENVKKKRKKTPKIEKKRCKKKEQKRATQNATKRNVTIRGSRKGIKKGNK